MQIVAIKSHKIRKKVEIIRAERERVCEFEKRAPKDWFNWDLSSIDILPWFLQLISMWHFLYVQSLKRLKIGKKNQHHHRRRRHRRLCINSLQMLEIRLWNAVFNIQKPLKCMWKKRIFFQRKRWCTKCICMSVQGDHHDQWIVN